VPPLSDIAGVANTGAGTARMTNDELISTLTGAISLLALDLAMMGLYGVMSCDLVQGTNESCYCVTASVKFTEPVLKLLPVPVMPDTTTV